MPMVMMCGFPCSGKSTRAIELANFLRQYNGKSVPVEESVDKSAESSGCKIKSRMQKGDAEINHLLPMKVFIVNEEELHIDRIETYSEGAREKSARGAIRAALERNLERNVVVIVDYMNNIKGFRYELHHRARSLKTNHCVVFCDTSAELCKDWNSQRQDSNGYLENQMEDLIGRFEPPNAARRWDNPLFTVHPGDSLPFEDIAEALFYGKTRNVSLATVPSELKDTNFLHNLDRVTLDIMKAVSSAQNSGTSSIGDLVSVPHSKFMVVLSRAISLPELKRLRNHFVKMAKLRPPSQADPESIGNSFVDFINTST